MSSSSRFACWPWRSGFEGLDLLTPAASAIVLGACLPMVRSSRWPILAGAHAAENILAAMLRR